jgi:hypothetical protein
MAGKSAVLDRYVGYSGNLCYADKIIKALGYVRKEGRQAGALQVACHHSVYLQNVSAGLLSPRALPGRRYSLSTLSAILRARNAGTETVATEGLQDVSAKLRNCC